MSQRHITAKVTWNQKVPRALYYRALTYCAKTPHTLGSGCQEPPGTYLTHVCLWAHTLASLGRMVTTTVQLCPASSPSKSCPEKKASPPNSCKVTIIPLTLFNFFFHYLTLISVSLYNTEVTFRTEWKGKINLKHRMDIFALYCILMGVKVNLNNWDISLLFYFKSQLTFTSDWCYFN